MQTQLIRSIYNVQEKHQGCVMTIGNFDGVHLGHQALIKQTLLKAKALNAPSLIMTFEPHAFEYFSKGEVTIPRLTRLREKFLYLADCGIENVLIIPFNQRFAELTASDFVSLIYENLHPRYLMIGDDFHFGYKRQGDIHLLQSLGKSLGFQTESIPTLLIDNERVSSTRVRKVLAAGDLFSAKNLLGRPYAMDGRVSHGEQRGRLWSFPTANIYLHRQLTPIKGVYTVLVHGIANHPLQGVANIGVRPTVDGTRTLLEVHLLDFNQDIYNRYVRVEFCQKLRDEERFANIELLRQQIAKDVTAAEVYFGTKTNV